VTSGELSGLYRVALVRKMQLLDGDVDHWLTWLASSKSHFGHERTWVVNMSKYREKSPCAYFAYTANCTVTPPGPTSFFFMSQGCHDRNRYYDARPNLGALRLPRQYMPVDHGRGHLPIPCSEASVQ
jgi:hypothetical protein